MGSFENLQRVILDLGFVNKHPKGQAYPVQFYELKDSPFFIELTLKNNEGNILDLGVRGKIDDTNINIFRELKSENKNITEIINFITSVVQWLVRIMEGMKNGNF